MPVWTGLSTVGLLIGAQDRVVYVATRKMHVRCGLIGTRRPAKQFPELRLRQAPSQIRCTRVAEEMWMNSLSNSSRLRGTPQHPRDRVAGHDAISVSATHPDPQWKVA